METEDYLLWVSVIVTALVIAALLFWFCLRKLGELWKKRNAPEVPVCRQETVTIPPDFLSRWNTVSESRRRDVNVTNDSSSRRGNVISDRRRRDLESIAPQILPHQHSTTDLPPRGEIIINRRSYGRYPNVEPPPIFTASLHYENEILPVPTTTLPTPISPFVVPTFRNAGEIDNIQIPPQPKAKKKPRKKQQAQRDESITAQITLFQDNLRSDENQHETVRKVQDLLLSMENRSEGNGTQCNLIIGVDATPGTQAGYCVNLVDKTLQYYVIKKQDLPWVLHDEKDTAEFEMKNLIFALTVWQMKILKFKRIRVYTDNFAIVRPNDKYGGRAKRYLDHFVNCEKVIIINKGSLAVNRFKNLKYFAKYIQPADDLSRWQIDKAVDFLTSLYNIDKENVLGTHQQQLQRKRKHSSSLMTAEALSVSKTWYNSTENYKHLLDLADAVIECHHCGNAACSSVLTSSLRIKPKPAIT